jgi:WD40 repeat protein
LGGLDGLQWRLPQLTGEPQRAALRSLLAHGDAGLQELTQWLNHPDLTIQKTVYALLRDRAESFIQPALQAFCPFPLFEELACFEHANGITAVGFSPNHRLLACACRDRTLVVWDIEAQEPRFVLDAEAVMQTVMIPDDQSLVALGSDRQPVAWSLHNGQPIDPYSLPVALDPPHPQRRPVLNGSVNQLADGWLDDGITWDSTAPSSQAMMPESVPMLKPNAIASVTTTPDRYLINSSLTTIRIWDLQRAREVAVLRGHTNLVKAVAISRDRQWIASGSDDKTVRLWGVP